MQIKEKINIMTKNRRTGNSDMLPVFIVLAATFLGLVFLADIKFGVLALLMIFLVLFVFMISIFTSSAKSLVFLIFLYPLLPYHLGYVFSQGLPVLRIHRILTAFILSYWLIKSKTAIASIKTFPLTRIFLAMLASMCAASAFSAAPFPSFFYTASFAIEYFLFAVMFFDLCTDEKTIEKVFLTIAVSSFLIALIGIFEFHSGSNIYSFIKPFKEEMSYAVIQQQREGLFRIRGSFDHSIAFGTYLGLSLVSVVYLYSMAKGLARKSFFAGIILVVSYTLLLTFSRLAFGFLLIFILTILFFKRRKELLVLAVLFFCFLIQPFYLQGIKEKLIFMFMSSFRPFEYGSAEMIASSADRLTQYNFIEKLIIQKPWFGYGKVPIELTSVDNFYLLFVLYFGLLSFAGFVLLNLSIIFKCFFLFMRGHLERIKLFGVAMIGALFGVFLVWEGASLESYFYLLWLYIGIAMRLHYDEKMRLKQKTA